MASLEKYSAPGVFEPATYSQAIKVTGAQTILFLAGQVAYDKDGGVLHPGNFKGQAREAGGGRMESIVKITTYLTDVRYRPDLVPIREEFFGKKGPASTLIQVSSLSHPDYLIEIEAIAVV